MVAVTLIGTIGAIASRRLNFNYMWLSIASCIVYTYIGYRVAAIEGPLMAIIVNNLVGFYDATVGLKLAIGLRANFELSEEDKKYLSPPYTISSMLFIATALALLGYYIVTH
ncbi:hypothetical protein [Paraflavitalea speifideaquila]|uniref:hypothetical protein n=1 Tax=Paraflavitalea speifideaquila TaxID=3076558 RepID=UPI0028EFAD31|nr:hypothetical protein [Paraflavitalea speifideiaquila]